MWLCWAKTPGFQTIIKYVIKHPFYTQTQSWSVLETDLLLLLTAGTGKFTINKDFILIPWFFAEYGVKHI